MAMASAKAMAKIMAVWTLEAASGFRPIDFTAEEPIRPIETAGATVPMAIAATVANKRTCSVSITWILDVGY